MNSPTATWRREVLDGLQGIQSAIHEARRFLEAQGVGPGQARDWEHVLAEAGNNAVEHAASPMAPPPVTLQLEVLPDAVCARITDVGPGFDWPASAGLPAPSSEGGRGLFIIQRLTDRSWYDRRPGLNVLHLVRQR